MGHAATAKGNPEASGEPMRFLIDDFAALYNREEFHPGLIIPGGGARTLASRLGTHAETRFSHQAPARVPARYAKAYATLFRVLLVAGGG